MAVTSMSVDQHFKNEIIVLFDGFAHMENSNLMVANCTCTLIRGKQTTTIVDTRTAWDGSDMINGKNICLKR